MSGPCGQKKQARPVFFSKYPFHIQILSEEAKNRTKKGQNPPQKKVFFQPLLPAG